MFNQIPYIMPNATAIAPSLNTASALKNTSLLGKINWSSLLSNTQKTLNVVNQAIPLYYQVKPVVSNIRTLGKIGKEFNKADKNVANNKNISNNNDNNIINENNNTADDLVLGPTFFI